MGWELRVAVAFPFARPGCAATVQLTAAHSLASNGCTNDCNFTSLNSRAVLTLLCPLPHPQCLADRQHNEPELANPTEVISLSLCRRVLGFGALFSKECKSFARSPEHQRACEWLSGSQANQAKRCNMPLGERTTNPVTSSAHLSCMIHIPQPQKLILLWIHPPAKSSCCRIPCAFQWEQQHSTNAL